jgi:hypothetical protein
MFTSQLKTQFVAGLILTGFAFSSALYADERHSDHGRMMGEGKNIQIEKHEDRRPMEFHRENDHRSDNHPREFHGNPHQFERHGSPHQFEHHYVERRPVEVHHDVYRTNVYHVDAHFGSVPRAHVHEVYDFHHGHNHYYPQRGYWVTQLPPRHEVIVHRGARFYFSSGVWYVPSGPRFIVTAPPIGLTIRFLPDIYTTVWFGHVPYYYANNVYYVETPQGYTVAQPPVVLGAVTPTASPSTRALAAMLYIYPREGQSVDQQDSDRAECHGWAVDQTGYDPNTDEGATGGNVADYKRAVSACLEGRGYTVR